MCGHEGESDLDGDVSAPMTLPLWRGWGNDNAGLSITKGSPKWGSGRQPGPRSRRQETSTTARRAAVMTALWMVDTIKETPQRVGVFQESHYALAQSTNTKAGRRSRTCCSSFARRCDWRYYDHLLAERFTNMDPEFLDLVSAPRSWPRVHRRGSSRSLQARPTSLAQGHGRQAKGAARQGGWNDRDANPARHHPARRAARKASTPSPRSTGASTSNCRPRRRSRSRGGVD
jgi:hypothetical protein